MGHLCLTLIAFNSDNNSNNRDHNNNIPWDKYMNEINPFNTSLKYNQLPI